MKNPVRFATLLLAAATIGSTAHAAGDAKAGEAVFQSQCAMCHSMTPGTAGIGPSLAGIYGKRAASTPGYDFSPALKAAKLTWTSDSLNTFLAAPQTTVPGTKMPYMGLTDPVQRADVVAYLAGK
jgi:cytochrome c